jgi:hypothetical protein
MGTLPRTLVKWEILPGYLWGYYTSTKTALFWQTNVDTNLSDIGDSHKVNGKIGLRVIW